MSKITNLNDFKKCISWFDIKNYECIRSLSIEEIKEQIFFRWEFLSDITSYNLNTDENEFCLIEENWARLLKGDVIFRYGEMEFDWDKGCLARTQAVRGLTSSEVYSHIGSLFEVNSIEIQDNNQLILSGEYASRLLDDYSKVKDLLKFGNPVVSDVHIVLNLKSHTDREVISDLKRLLPKWRDDLNITEPKGIIYAKDKDYEKVAGYKIIPLLDLWIWEKYSERAIPLSVLSLVLYPLGEKGEKALIDTVIPLAKKLLSSKYRHI